MPTLVHRTPAATFILARTARRPAGGNTTALLPSGSRMAAAGGTTAACDFSIVELIATYWRYAHAYYTSPLTAPTRAIRTARRSEAPLRRHGP